ncbi:MAG TPA: sulfite exporter TauE/SafE family protein [Cryptosporangiaceae bacterium]|nr:sulfite exporter TauE/SafE family protein [Cryptosporangiaceae bacterium]
MSNLSAVLVTGLFAGGVSCAAVQGGLLAGLVARQRDRQPAPALPGRTKGRVKATVAVDDRPPMQRLADDAAPVGGFLVGKLVSHTLLGALLGALGGAVQLSVGVRAMTQIAAGILVIVFGLAQLGVPAFRGLVIQPPAAWSRFVRGRARSSAAGAPALLGFATILVPCGVTLSVEALALASGSAMVGAATMAVFVLGTSPLFALLGYAARRAATAWRGRLAAATGLVVIGLGLYTLNGGLELTGSPLSASRIAQAAGFGSQPVTAAAAPTDAPPVTVTGGQQTIVLTARTGEYTPANIAVRAGVPTTLVVRSEGAEGCVRSFVIPSLGRQWVLPVNGDTPIDLGVLQPGRFDYTCGMGMYTGQLTVGR